MWYPPGAKAFSRHARGEVDVWLAWEAPWHKHAPPCNAAIPEGAGERRERVRQKARSAAMQRLWQAGATRAASPHGGPLPDWRR